MLTPSCDHKFFRSFAIPGFWGLLTGLMLLTSPPGRAATEVQDIAAIVNDEVISRYDLEQRIKLMMLTGALQPNREIIERIRRQVLRSLVDEKLQLQEARRLEIRVSDEEIEQAMERIASRSNRELEEVKKFLLENGVGTESLQNQIIADIAWNRVVSRQLAPFISVGNTEVESILERILNDSDQTQYRVSEIVLGFDNPSQEAEASRGAERLVEQIRSGTPFQVIAAQFSQAASAANGGDIGWVQQGQLKEALANTVANMSPGQVSDPVRTVNGFYILQMNGRQTGFEPNPLLHRFELIRFFLPLVSDAAPDVVAKRQKQDRELRARFTTCKALSESSDQFGDAVISPRAPLEAGQAAEPLRSQLLAHEAGQIIPAIRTRSGLEIFIICDRKDHQGNKPTREMIEDNLFNQRISMMGRRHLRDLRRDAIVELR